MDQARKILPFKHAVVDVNQNMAFDLFFFPLSVFHGEYSSLVMRTALDDDARRCSFTVTNVRQVPRT